MESSCPSTKDKHYGRGSKEKSQGPRDRSCSLYVLTASFWILDNFTVEASDFPGWRQEKENSEWDELLPILTLV